MFKGYRNLLLRQKLKIKLYECSIILLFLISAASSLIRGMLTVKAEERANIIDICSHWWINDGYTRNCLEEAEYLASLTPVRLDLLLSLTRQEKREPPDEAKSEVGSRFRVRVHLGMGKNFLMVQRKQEVCKFRNRFLKTFAFSYTERSCIKKLLS